MLINGYIKYFILLLIAFSVTHSTAQTEDEQPPVTVEYVNLKLYSGLWYEIAKIQNSFQDHCVYGTTAEYHIDEDGDIIVVNSCYEADDNLDVAEGLAKVVDEITNSKLEVSFVSFFGIRPFWGDYWIIGLDENYEYAIIGHPERKYGWVLSRAPSLDEETLNLIIEKLEIQGYNWNDFELTLHKQ